MTRLNLISKNIVKKNRIELLFKHVKHFDAQNPAIGSSIKEVTLGKKQWKFNKFLDKALDVRELEIQSRLNKLYKKNEFSLK